jgi:3-hydroxymyristoyl/3-hydroxydecanoyl-(acyl carrier protein) dehydratase
MFTYINENFLHAPSVDLSRDTVKTLIVIMLAQAQEVFLEKQITDKKKGALIAKLASQAASLYGQAIEGVQENVNKAIFEKVWLLVVQVRRFKSIVVPSDRTKNPLPLRGGILTTPLD